MKYLILILLSVPILVNAQTSNYMYRSKLDANDYLLGDRAPKRDAVFEGQERYAKVDVNLGIGSDCGRVSFQNTLKAALKNVLDTKYFAQVGQDIVAGAPMLALCYYSSTWCSILKNMKLQANWLGKLRLDQCSLMDKYTDSRVEDFYAERQECVHKAIEKNGGNMESAMDKCKNWKVWNHNLSDWAGGSNKTASNKLIDSSAKWAGFTDPEGSKVVKFVKSLVGDSIISKGRVSVDWGPRRMQLSPRLHFRDLKKKTYSELCGKLVKKVQSAPIGTDVNQIVSNDDLAKVSGSNTKYLLDKQTVRSLSYMSFKQRRSACEKLSDAIALTRFTNDMDQAVDVLNIFENNPNLPDKRKRELQRKTRNLKDSIDLVVQLHRNKSEPLNKVLYQINSTGSNLIDRETGKYVQKEETRESSTRIEQGLWDCADGIMCGNGGV